jgi:hypothetical protein
LEGGKITKTVTQMHLNIGLMVKWYRINYSRLGTLIKEKKTQLTLFLPILLLVKKVNWN